MAIQFYFYNVQINILFYQQYLVHNTPFGQLSWYVDCNLCILLYRCNAVMAIVLICGHHIQRLCTETFRFWNRAQRASVHIVRPVSENVVYTFNFCDRKKKIFFCYSTQFNIIELFLGMMILRIFWVIPFMCHYQQTIYQN